MGTCHIPWTKMEVHENRMAGCYLAVPQQHWQMKCEGEDYWDYLLRPFDQLRNSQDSMAFRRQHVTGTTIRGAELCGTIENMVSKPPRCNGGFHEFQHPCFDTPARIKANADLLYNEWLRGAIELHSYPLTWAISLGASCHMRCVMCPINHAVRIPSMPLSVAENLREALDYATDICVTGGEPLDAPVKVLDALLPERAPYRRTIVLTALSVSPGVVDLLPERVSNVTVSLSSWNRDVYEQVQVGGDFEQVIDNIKRLAGRVRLECSTIVTRSTLDTLDRMPAFLAELGFSAWIPTPMTSVKQTDEDIFIPDRWLAYRNHFAEVHERTRANAEALDLQTNWSLMEAKLR